MSYGWKDVNGCLTPWGFASMTDWLDSVILSFPAPWILGPRDGKYYGTEILDARGKKILSLWISVGDPSAREKEYFGDWTPEAWTEYCCDSHWESEAALKLAEAIVALRNADSSWSSRDTNKILQGLLLACEVRWEEEIWPEIQAGGPGKRALAL